MLLFLIRVYTVIIRTATYNDIYLVKDLFIQTILSVNTKDYSQEQAACWASKGEDDKIWEERIDNQYFIVAEDNRIIKGFAALKPDGYINSLFVHKDYQNIGVASRLLTHIEEYAQQINLKELTADVSITAKPFFERKGYIVLQQQTVDIGVKMINFKMKKSIS